MPQVQSIDWDAKRVFLHPDTVSAGVSGILIYEEIRDEIFANTSRGQGYFPPLTKEGGRAKGGGSFTPTFTEWRQGWRLVPDANGGAAYRLDILDELISLDGLSDRDVFDRSGVSTNVDIDAVYDPVEVKEVNTGSGITAQDKAEIATAVWGYLIEAGFSAEEVARIILSATAGKGGDDGSGIYRYRDIADTKDRIVAPVSGSERTSVTLDPS